MSLEEERKRAQELSIQDLSSSAVLDPWERVKRRNAQSKERVRLGREKREAIERAKLLEDMGVEEEEKKSSAGGSEKGGLFDLSTDNYKPPEENQTDRNKDIDLRGIDRIGGTEEPQTDFYDIIPATGLVIFPVDGSAPTIIATEDIFETFDPTADEDWSIELAVSGLVWTGSITYNAQTELYDDTGEDQTVARIPVSRSNNLATYFGSYQEGLRCVNGELVVEFYRI